jgi:hypothetical protein
MNTGIMDAHNLGWKLALVASGRSPDCLLDTYGEERAPVAAEVLGLTHALVQLGTVRHPFKRVLRDTLVPIASRIPPVQRRAVRRLGQVHVSYRSSSLTRPNVATGSLQPGDRAPDVEVVALGGAALRLYEALRDGRHLVVTPPDDELADLTEYGATFDVVRCRRGPAWLVRPDGYLAAIGMAGIREYLRQVFPGAGILSQRPVPIPALSSVAM